MLKPRPMVWHASSQPPFIVAPCELDFFVRPGYVLQTSSIFSSPHLDVSTLLGFKGVLPHSVKIPPPVRVSSVEKHHRKRKEEDEI